MEPTSGRLTFEIGRVFPADDPLAVWLIALSTGLNDLLTTSRWIVGGSERAPGERQVSDAEQQYLLRVSFAQLFELRETIKHGLNLSVEPDGPKPIAEFVDTLPTEARADLAQVLAVNTNQDQWILATIKYVRNQTNHYGGKHGWAETEWALRTVAAEQGEVEMTSPHLAGMRLRYADLVAIQHLLRKSPEYSADPLADVDDETIRVRLSALFQAASESVAAAQNFVVAAINHHLEAMPDEVIDAHIDAEA